MNFKENDIMSLFFFSSAINIISRLAARRGGGEAEDRPRAPLNKKSKKWGENELIRPSTNQ